MSTLAHSRHQSIVRALVLGLFVLSPALLVEAAPLKQANVTRIYNDVRVMEVPANVQKPATLNQVVRDQQAVLTGVQSRAELLFTDKTLTRIGANSIFTFKEGTRDMDLKRGTMLLQVPKGAGGAQIKTAAVTAAITGTTLLVEYQPGDGATAQTFAPTTGITDTSNSVSPVADPAPASTGEGAVASDVEGNARILVPGESAFRPLREGESIPAGSSLMTSDSGSAVVSPAPGVVLRLLPNSVLRVNEATASGNTPKVRLDLKEGGVINIISKAKYEQVDYEVSTPRESVRLVERCSAFSSSTGKSSFWGPTELRSSMANPSVRARRFRLERAEEPFRPTPPSSGNSSTKSSPPSARPQIAGWFPPHFCPKSGNNWKEAERSSTLRCVINSNLPLPQAILPGPKWPVRVGRRIQAMATAKASPKSSSSKARFGFSSPGNSANPCSSVPVR